MLKPIQLLIVFALWVLFAGASLAQTTEVSFGKNGHDTSQPVEIVADSFSISQNRGNAEFTGNVVVGQGDMRLSADLIKVVYEVVDGQQTGRIENMLARGKVTLVAGEQAAEADEAVYNVDRGNIVMSGNVLFTQGQNALSGGKMTINLADGAARFEGRVRTIFQTGGSQ